MVVQRPLNLIKRNGLDVSYICTGVFIPLLPSHPPTHPPEKQPSIKIIICNRERLETTIGERNSLSHTQFFKESGSREKYVLDYWFYKVFLYLYIHRRFSLLIFGGSVPATGGMMVLARAEIVIVCLAGRRYAVTGCHDILVAEQLRVSCE